EPGQLLLVDERACVGAWEYGDDAAEAGDAGGPRRRAALAAALDVGLEPEQPVVGLPVVAYLAAADHAVEARRRRREDCRPGAKAGRVVGLAEAAAEIHAEIPAGPAENRSRRRRRLERHVGCARGIGRGEGSDGTCG